MNGNDIWDEPDVPQSLQCPNCGTRYPPTSSTCQQCGLDLWKDGERIYSSEIVSSEIVIGNISNAQRSLQTTVRLIEYQETR
jgi:hypothetical protein